MIATADASVYMCFFDVVDDGIAYHATTKGRLGIEVRINRYTEVPIQRTKSSHVQLI